MYAARLDKNTGQWSNNVQSLDSKPNTQPSDKLSDLREVILVAYSRNKLHECAPVAESATFCKDKNDLPKLSEVTESNSWTQRTFWKFSHHFPGW